MPHGVRFMHIVLYGSLVIAVIAAVLFVIAGFGKSKK
jgi:hypothetical protein